MTSPSPAKQAVDRYAAAHSQLATAFKNATAAHDKLADSLTDAGTELVDAAEAELATAKQVRARAEQIHQQTRDHIAQGLAKAQQLYDQTFRELKAATEANEQKITAVRREADKHIEARTAEIASEYREKLAGLLQREKDIHATDERLRRDNEGVKAQAEAAVAKLNKQLADAQQKITDLERQRDTTAAAVKQQQQQIATLTDEAKRLRAETAKATGDAATVRAELDVVRNASAAEVKKHKHDAATALAAADKARTELNTTTKELGSSIADATQHRRLAAERHGDLTIANDANAKLTAEVRALKESKAKADGIAQARGEELDTQRTKHAEALETANTRIRRLEAELAALKANP